METIPIHKQFQTPPEVAQLMARLMPQDTYNILEPTKGEGNLLNAIVTELNARYTSAWDQIEIDINAPEDYFLLDKNLRFDCVLMNPPFSEKYANLENAPFDYVKRVMRLGYRMLLECMEKSDHVIALMPWFTITDSEKRLQHLLDYGLEKIISLPRKTFPNARVQTCVLVLNKKFKGKTTFENFTTTFTIDINFKDMGKQYYIQNKSLGYLGNAIYFWAKDRRGYTPDLNNSEIFTEEQAKKICLGNPEKNKAWPVEYINNCEAVKKVVDMQYLDEDQIAKFLYEA